MAALYTLVICVKIFSFDVKSLVSIIMEMAIDMMMSINVKPSVTSFPQNLRASVAMPKNTAAGTSAILLQFAIKLYSYTLLGHLTGVPVGSHAQG